MYLVKKITLDDKQGYLSSKIVDHTLNKKINNALIMLENAVRIFVREEMGREAADKMKVLDLKNFDQVNEPIIDGILCYRIAEDAHRIHIYQRKTVVVKVAGWIRGSTETPASTFRRTHIYELEQYDCQNLTSGEGGQIVPQIEMVAIGPANIRVPKALTEAPLKDLITQLKNSPRFKARVSVALSSSSITKSAPVLIGGSFANTSVNTPPKKAATIDIPRIPTPDFSLDGSGKKNEVSIQKIESPLVVVSEEKNESISAKIVVDV